MNSLPLHLIFHICKHLPVNSIINLSNAFGEIFLTKDFSELWQAIEIHIPPLNIFYKIPLWQVKHLRLCSSAASQYKNEDDIIFDLRTCRAIAYLKLISANVLQIPFAINLKIFQSSFETMKYLSLTEVYVEKEDIPSLFLFINLEFLKLDSIIIDGFGDNPCILDMKYFQKLNHLELFNWSTTATWEISLPDSLQYLSLSGPIDLQEQTLPQLQFIQVDVPLLSVHHSIFNSPQLMLVSTVLKHRTKRFLNRWIDFQSHKWKWLKIPDDLPFNVIFVRDNKLRAPLTQIPLHSSCSTCKHQFFDQVYKPFSCDL